ncbi:hypothetical protein ACP4OV_026754 [Aristida adscensionis]
MRDVFYARWDEVLVGATAAVSTIGGFGNEEQMKRINGEANVIAVDAAKEFGIPKFILISVHDYNLPSFLLTSGYFTGKRKAESEVLSKYPASGVVLRPAFIYGKRRVNGYDIPLDVVGQPLEKLLNSVENFTKPLSSLPASDLILAPPVSVDDVADAVVNAVIDDSFFGVFTIEQIKEAAAKVYKFGNQRSSILLYHEHILLNFSWAPKMGPALLIVCPFQVLLIGNEDYCSPALIKGGAKVGPPCRRDFNNNSRIYSGSTCSFRGNQQRSNDAEAPNIAERRPLENNHQWRHYGPQPWIGGDFLDPSLDLFQSN